MTKKSKPIKKSPPKEKGGHDVAAAKARAQIAHSIKLFRKKVGLTQQQLAAKAKISGRYLAELERQGGQNVTIDSLSHIATALDINISDLIDGPSAMVRSRTAAIKTAIVALQHYCAFLEGIDGTSPVPEAETTPDPDTAHEEAVARRRGKRKPK